MSLLGTSIRDLPRLVLAVLALNPRVLDGQAPNVKVVANGDNDIDHKAAVHARRQAKHAKHVSNLVDVITESAGPAEPVDRGVLLNDGADRVNDTKRERHDHNVPVGEVELDQVGRDHLADAVRVDETAEDREGNQVVVQNRRLQP